MNKYLFINNQTAFIAIFLYSLFYIYMPQFLSKRKNLFTDGKSCSTGYEIMDPELF